MMDAITEETKTFQGQAAASGIARGLVFRWEPVSQVENANDDPLSALDKGFCLARKRLEAALQNADAALAPLLNAQLLMLDDPDLRDGSVELVMSGTAPAEAVITVAGQLAAVLEGAQSGYFRERAIDVRAIGNLVAEAITGNVRNVPRGVLVIAEELAPFDTARLIDAGVAAFVTLRGGPTCHAAIVARAWGIPAITGIAQEALEITDGTPAYVDGDAGILTIYPPQDLPDKASPTPNIKIQRRVPVYANVGSLAEAQRAVALGAEGIGLLRTEFLFLDRTTPPTEDEQTESYSAIMRQLGDRPSIIRTLDIGADKPAAFLPMQAEPNPQLGLRGIRLSLQHRDILVTQLRALVRASAQSPLSIMLPMVTISAEMREVRGMLESISAEMQLPVPSLGAMIEVPMAALAAEELSSACDFFSLGTNDLLQFLLAADRQHAGVSYLHTQNHPAVWGMLKHVIDVAHNANIPVGLCGEWGSDAEKLAKLVEIGLDSVSVAVGALPRVKALF